MSLTLSCDSCGKVISPADLSARLALEHEGSHYCADCKGPILSFLKRASASQARAEEPDPLDKLGPPGPPPAVPRARPAPAAAAAPRPPSALEPELEADLEADLEALAAVPGPADKPAPPPAAARKAKAASPGPRQAPGHPDQAGAARPAAPPALKAPRPGVPSPAPRPAGAVGGVARGEAAARQAPGPLRPGPRPAAQPGPARPLGLRVKPKPVPGAAASKDLPADDGGDAAPPRARRKALLAGGIGGGVVILGLAIALTVLLRTPTAQPAASGSTAPAGGAAAGPAEPRGSQETAESAKLLLEKDQRELESYRSRLSAEPEKLLVLRDQLDLYVPPPSIESEYRQLVDEVEKRIRALAENDLGAVKARSAAYQKEEKFTAAGDLWKVMPDIVARSVLRSRWTEEGERAGRYARAWAHWTKIDQKADKYLRQLDVDIAVAILEYADNYPPRCEAEFPIIWAKRNARIQSLRVNAESARLEVAQRDLERRREEEERERIRLEQERQARWAQLVEEKPWVALLSKEGDDLENWSVKSIVGQTLDDFRYPWKLQTVGGQQVLVGDNSDNEQDIEIGMNGNRWLDWVLEFELLVESEKLSLKTRTVVSGGFSSATVVESSKEDFEFPSASYGSWKRVRVEARGRKVLLIEGGATKKEVDSSDHQNGGFSFVLDAKGSAKIRDVRLKLIFDEKRPRDEDEAEAEEGEDEG